MHVAHSHNGFQHCRKDKTGSCLLYSHGSEVITGVLEEEKHHHSDHRIVAIWPEDALFQQNLFLPSRQRTVEQST